MPCPASEACSNQKWRTVCIFHQLTTSGRKNGGQYLFFISKWPQVNDFHVIAGPSAGPMPGAPEHVGMNLRHIFGSAVGDMVFGGTGLQWRPVPRGLLNVLARAMEGGDSEKSGGVGRHWLRLWRVTRLDIIIHSDSAL